MVAEIGRVFGTLTYRILTDGVPSPNYVINYRTYSAYCGHLARQILVHKRCSSRGSLVLPYRLVSVLTIGSSNITAPIRLFKFVWGLPAGTEDPQIHVLDNLPRYGS
jgi:hypothetical protein